MSPRPSPDARGQVQRGNEEITHCEDDISNYDYGYDYSSQDSFWENYLAWETKIETDTSRELQTSTPIQEHHFPEHFWSPKKLEMDEDASLITVPNNFVSTDNSFQEDSDVDSQAETVILNHEQTVYSDISEASIAPSLPDEWPSFDVWPHALEDMLCLCSHCSAILFNTLSQIELCYSSTQ
ncbi:uncharacterized protein LOC124155071 [Ischnura elegans]|uniref:uncharacterized protein LOC124155071 n=1 Tax=Ischnura elegans TaxID=197161 RepID=UPI001ED8B3B5|nr:uncharacterized protein LOC124155071 [Ischnura elegans]